LGFRIWVVRTQNTPWPFKTSKTSITLTCTPLAAKRKRGFEAEEDEELVRRQTNSLSVSTPTVTIFYTLPQSRSTSIISFSTSSIKTVIASKYTETDTYTSRLIKTSVFPGQTFTSTFQATKVVSKSTTLPVSTSTILVDLQGTSVVTLSLGVGELD
jgi:hypothetical protein